MAVNTWPSKGNCLCYELVYISIVLAGIIRRLRSCSCRQGWLAIGASSLGSICNSELQVLAETSHHIHPAQCTIMPKYTLSSVSTIHSALVSIKLLLTILSSLKVLWYECNVRLKTQLLCAWMIVITSAITLLPHLNNNNNTENLI